MLQLDGTKDVGVQLEEVRRVLSKGGKWELVKPQRTQKQNKAIHALFTDLATELNGLGIDLRFGNFSASYTPVMAKEFFIQIYLAGRRTSECNTVELAEAINCLISDVNKRGGNLSIKNADYLSLLKTCKE